LVCFSFRSHVYIEFGAPLHLDQSISDPKEQVRDLTHRLDVALHALTINAPDFATLLDLRLAKSVLVDGRTLSLDQTIEMTRRIASLYEQKKDQPEILLVKSDISQYRQTLESLGLQDWQVCVCVCVCVFACCFCFIREKGAIGAIIETSQVHLVEFGLQHFAPSVCGFWVFDAFARVSLDAIRQQKSCGCGGKEPIETFDHFRPGSSPVLSSPGFNFVLLWDTDVFVVSAFCSNHWIFFGA
jgi:hypothetical protein